MSVFHVANPFNFNNFFFFFLLNAQNAPFFLKKKRKKEKEKQRENSKNKNKKCGGSLRFIITLTLLWIFHEGINYNYKMSVGV
jgi:hypothetical protein